MAEILRIGQKVCKRGSDKLYGIVASKPTEVHGSRVGYEVCDVLIDGFCQTWFSDDLVPYVEPDVSA